jgi:hypothetical protein
MPTSASSVYAHVTQLGLTEKNLDVTTFIDGRSWSITKLTNLDDRIFFAKKGISVTETFTEVDRSEIKGLVDLEDNLALQPKGPESRRA